MKIPFPIIILSFFVTIPLRAEPELRGIPTELAEYLKQVPGTITLTGTAEIHADADHALVSVSINTESRTLKDAVISNQQKRTEIVRILAAAGIDTDRIHTAKFSTGENLGYLSGKTKSHSVFSSVEITAKTEEEVQVVAGISDSDTSISTDSIQFKHSDKEQHRLAAIEAALKSIQAEKAVYEKMLNVTLTPRSTPSAGLPNSPVQLQGFGRSQKGLSPQSLSSLKTSMHHLEQHYSQFDRLTYTATVHIVFDLAAK